MNPDISHIIPSPNSIPMKGGICVRALKTGTIRRIARPEKNIIFCSRGAVVIVSLLTLLTIFPLIVNEKKINGVSKQTSEGTKRLIIVFKGAIRPPAHNIVVVTSPMGDQ